MLIMLMVTILLALSGCMMPAQSNNPAPDGRPSQSSLPDGTDNVPEATSRPTRPDPSSLQTARVVDITDGDTIRVRLQDKVEKLRLIGVNSPELSHPTRGEEPYAQAAREYTRQKLSNQTVLLEFDVQQNDQYGRLLAYVWQDEEMLNMTLLKEGYAQMVTFPPNLKYVDFFRSAQREAIQTERGLWGLKDDLGSSASSKGAFLGSTSSNKYHFPECDWAQRIAPSKQVWFQSRSEAALTGYEPCGTCSP